MLLKMIKKAFKVLSELFRGELAFASALIDTAYRLYMTTSWSSRSAGSELEILAQKAAAKVQKFWEALESRNRFENFIRLQITTCNL